MPKHSPVESWPGFIPIIREKKPANPAIPIIWDALQAIVRCCLISDDPTHIPAPRSALLPLRVLWTACSSMWAEGDVGRSIRTIFTFSTILPFYGVMLWPLRVSLWFLSLYLQFVHSVLLHSIYSVHLRQASLVLLVVGQKLLYRRRPLWPQQPGQDHSGAEQGVWTPPVLYRFWPTSTGRAHLLANVGGKCWPTATSVTGIIPSEKW